MYSTTARVCGHALGLDMCLMPGLVGLAEWQSLGRCFFFAVFYFKNKGEYQSQRYLNVSHKALGRSMESGIHCAIM